MELTLSIESEIKNPCLHCGKETNVNTLYKCTSHKTWTDCGYEYDCNGSEPNTEGEDIFECEQCPASACQKCAEEYKRRGK